MINYEDILKARDKADFEIMDIVPSKPPPLKNRDRRKNVDVEGNSFKNPYPISSCLPQILSIKNNLSGNVTDRTKIRKIMLENFHINCSDQESYKRCFKNLIDFEEEFTHY